MRYKMKIEASCECSHCLEGTTETLKHFHDCPKVKAPHFYISVQYLFKLKIDRECAGTKLHHFTRCHQNWATSYVCLAANWYVGGKIQHGKELINELLGGI